MGYLDKRREKRARQLAAEQGTGREPEDEREQKARAYRKSNRWADIKKSIPGIGFSVLAFFISFATLNSAVGELVALSITIPSMIVIYSIMWLMLSRTYVPAYEKFFLVGHVDPDNKDSAILVQKWLIPKQIAAGVKVQGTQFMLETMEGMMWFVRRLEFDWGTGELYVEFGWPHLDEFSFLLDHGVFHNMEEIIPLLFKKIQMLEGSLKVLVTLGAQELANTEVKSFLHALLDVTGGKSEADLNRFKEKIDEINKEVEIRLNPKKVNVDPVMGDANAR